MTDNLVNVPYYGLWQLIISPWYSVPLLFQVELWRASKVKERDYATSIKWIVEQSKAKRGFLYHLFFMFGPRYQKPMFIMWQFIFTSVSILPTYYFYYKLDTFLSSVLPAPLPWYI